MSALLKKSATDLLGFKTETTGQVNLPVQKMVG